jgi:hemerythrin-like domain-containing protein
MQEGMSRQRADQLLAEEHETLNRLMDELRAEIAVVPRSGLEPWIDRLKERFAHFEAHLVKHMALEEQGGYLAPVLGERPTLNKQVARLKHQHAEFVRLLKLLRQQVEQLDPADSILPRDWCHHVARLLAYVEQHEHEEDLLLIDGVSRDIGVKD